MKHFSTIFAVVILAIFSFSAKSQELSRGPECLGIWCTVDVDLATDGAQGINASYPIPHTPEFFGNMQGGYSDSSYVVCYGPGYPHITVQGGEAELHLNLKNLEIEATVMAEQQGNNTGYVETMVDFPVQRTVNVFGSSIQCHYHIRLVVRLK